MDFDVVVVGASSAGLFAAQKLARAGKHVAIFEQLGATRLCTPPTPMPARRTLIVTPHLRRILSDASRDASLRRPYSPRRPYSTDLPHDVVLHKIHHMELTSPGATARITFDDPDLIVERRALLSYLTDRAKAAGVTFFQGHRFRSVRACRDGAELVFEQGEGRSVHARAAAIIGADGVFSDVASAVGISHADTVPILQAEIHLPKNWDPALAQVWFDTDDTRFFYWLIPESPERAVVGLVGDERAQVRRLLQRFLDRRGWQPLAFQGARIALHHPRLKPWARVGNAPVLLVGDAAGQVKVTTVGGTVSGLLGAQAAVRALLNGTSYARELGALRRELNLHWVLRVLLDRLDNSGYAALLRLVSPRLEEFLGKYHRDEMAGHAWQLVWSQPALLTLGLRIILKPPTRRRLDTSPDSAAMCLPTPE